MVSADVPAPAGGAGPVSNPIGEKNQPGPVLAKAGVPRHRRGIDTLPSEERFGQVAERLVRGAARTVWGSRPRLLDPALPLGQHRPLEARHPLHRNAGRVSDVLRGLARPQPSLNLPRRERALPADLQLAQPGDVAAHRGPQPLVERQPELLTVRLIGADDQVRTIVADRNEAKLAHAQPPVVRSCRRARQSASFAESRAQPVGDRPLAAAVGRDHDVEGSSVTTSVPSRRARKSSVRLVRPMAASETPMVRSSPKPTAPRQSTSVWTLSLIHISE